MYGIFTNIYPINDPNVGKYTIHGSYGIISIYHKILVISVINQHHQLNNSDRLGTVPLQFPWRKHDSPLLAMGKRVKHVAKTKRVLVPKGLFRCIKIPMW